MNAIRNHLRPSRLAPVAVPFLMLLAGSALAEPARSPATAAAEARADIGKTLGFVPRFFLDVPDVILPGTWEEMKGLQLNPKTALPPKVKELIGLAVAAQVPCKYCIIAHTDFAKLNGATDAEVGDAVALAAITRHWSTWLNGIQTDDAKFKAEINQIITNAKAASGKTPPAPVTVTDGASALKDINNTLGFTPEFLKRFPESARAGAWRTMKDAQLGPTALSGKAKELVGLAVASQVPCKFCVIAHTEFARLNGATDAEINEAVAMAAFTRHMSTVLNGRQSNEAQFRKDIDKLIKGARAAAAAKSRPTTTAQNR